MTDQSPQVDPQYVIAALQEELSAVQANRLYLLSLLKAMQGEYASAQEMWALERESLVKDRESTD